MGYDVIVIDTDMIVTLLEGLCALGVVLIIFYGVLKLVELERKQRIEKEKEESIRRYIDTVLNRLGK